MKMDIWKIIFIIFGILVLGYLITNNIYITHNIKEPSKDDYVCKFNGIIEKKESVFEQYGLPNPISSPENMCFALCSIGSKYYYKDKIIPYCDENNIPLCDCKVSVYSYYIYPIFKSR